MYGVLHTYNVSTYMYIYLRKHTYVTLHSHDSVSAGLGGIHNNQIRLCAFTIRGRLGAHTLIISIFKIVRALGSYIDGYSSAIGKYVA